MAASTNATRVFFGTAWTSRTLLARELRAARALEKQDGIKRAFVVDADQVAAEVPPYGAFVAGQVATLGRNNPMVRTQFFCEEIDAEGGLFNPERQAIMQGTHPAQAAPQPDQTYLFLLDVAGQDENSADPTAEDLANPGRDSTSLTIVKVMVPTGAVIQRPEYQVINRRQWIGTKHTSLFSQLTGLVELWQPRYVVVDATGVGAGLASFLSAAYPNLVIPFTFNSSTKSKLGWDFLSIIDSGRWKEPIAGAEHDLLFQQLNACQYEIKIGPDKKMLWSVPDGTRDTATGDLIHDDLILSSALVAVVDEMNVLPTQKTLIIPGVDPLTQMDHGF